MSGEVDGEREGGWRSEDEDLEKRKCREESYSISQDQFAASRPHSISAQMTNTRPSRLVGTLSKLFASVSAPYIISYDS